MRGKRQCQVLQRVTGIPMQSVVGSVMMTGPGSDLKKILEYHQETIIKFPVRGRLFGGVPVYSDSLCNP